MTDPSAVSPAVPVRILMLLILTSALAGARPSVLLAALPLLLAAGAFAWRGDWRDACTGVAALLRRVRWLLLAIGLLYGWFMPGTPVQPELLGAFAPTHEGLQEGVRRMTALLLIVLAVYLLLNTTARGELLAGLLWFGRPLRRIGLNDARFAVRLVLALEAVGQVQNLLRQARTTDAAGGRLQHAGRAAASVVQAALQRADAAPPAIDVPDARPVPAWQWSLPIGLAAVLWGAAQW